MTSHTPVLLAVSDTGTLYNKAAVHQHADPLKLISPWIEDAWGDDEEAAANMRRLAACWNACHGVPIEVLEANAAGGLPWRVPDQIDRRVQADRMAQLLQALVKSGAGQQVLANIKYNGIGTETDEGRAWLEAGRLVASLA